MGEATCFGSCTREWAEDHPNLENLTDIRWSSLLSGERNPVTKCSLEEQQRRTQEASQLLSACMKMNFWRTINGCGSKQWYDQQKRHCLHSKIAFVFLITNGMKWLTLSTYKVHSSVYSGIRKLRHEQDQQLKPTLTANRKGAEFDILRLLRWLFTHQPPKDPNKPVRLKFAFDGATIMIGLYKKQSRIITQLSGSFT